MRVSKTVREYIEKQVALRFPKTESELQYEQNTNLVNAVNQEYEDRVKKAKEQIVQDLIKEKGITEDIAKVNDLRYGTVFTTWGTKAKEQADFDHNERKKAEREKVEEIVITLELGGTKADLEKMLAEI